MYTNKAVKVNLRMEKLTRFSLKFPENINECFVDTNSLALISILMHKYLGRMRRNDLISDSQL